MSTFNVSVCFSPVLYPEYASKNNVAVVIDVLRATSAICTALHYGAKKIIPVVSVEVAKDYLKTSDIVAAERDGQIVEGFDYGNSPLSYAGDHVKDKTIVLTTSNGTFAISAAAQSADKIIIGSFLNLDSVVRWINSQDQDVVLLCSGWKRKFNLEDSLFAGAVVNGLLKSDKSYENASKYLTKGASGLVSFEVESVEIAKQILDKVELFSIVANIGDSKSIINHSASTTHQQLSKEELEKAGVPEGLIRLSIGLEDEEDLIADLEKALS